MVLNISVGNMYGWVTHTWNPANGTCEHDCIYCYVKRGRQQGWKHDIMLKKAIDDNLGSGKTIFVCTQTDLFGEWVPGEIIERVLKQCAKYPSNTYLFQSKNPHRFGDFSHQMPINTILCTTVETNRNVHGISKAPTPYERCQAMYVNKKMGYKTSITIEPIIDFDLDELFNMIKIAMPDFISIGADSKKSGLPEPDSDKVRLLISKLNDCGIKIEKKNNLERIIGA